MQEPFKYVNHMVFNVKDLDKAIAFYTEVVGMKLTMHFRDRGKAFLSFGKNFADIRLFEVGDQYDWDHKWHGFNHVAFLPDGPEEILDELEARLKDKGAKIEGREEYAGGRHKSLYFYDPDGNRLEFYWENLSWVNETRGKVAKAFGDVEGPLAEGATIDLYAAGTANNVKVGIMLKLLGIPHKVIPVSLKPGDEKPEGFAQASITGKVPALVDHETGVTIAESGAILMYLAEKTESELLPKTGKARANALQWLFAAASTFNPAMTEGRFFLHVNAGKSELGEERVSKQIARAYATADAALAKSQYLAGDEMTLADLVLWPYVGRFEWQKIDLNDYPHVKQWYVRLAEIDAFKQGWDILGKGDTPLMPS